MQGNRAVMSRTDMQIVPEFERACELLVPAFGAMWALVYALVATGAVM